MEDIIDAHVIDAEQYVLSQHYFFRTKTYRSRRSLFDWEDCTSPNSPNLNDNEFPLLFRVIRASFSIIRDAIKDSKFLQSGLKHTQKRYQNASISFPKTNGGSAKLAH